MRHLGVGVLASLLVVTACKKSGGDKAAEARGHRFPSKLWRGGGTTITIEAETSCRAKVSASFSEGEDRHLEAWEEVAAGSHRWRLEVGAEVYALIEAGCDQPEVDDTLRLRVLIDGATHWEDSTTLEEELEEGYAFFVGVEYRDLATGTFTDIWD